MIHDGDSEAIFGRIEELVDGLGPAPAYRELFARAIASVRESAEAVEVFLPVDLPMAVADVLDRPVAERHAAAVASTLLWSGADLMDDAADGELDGAWSDVAPSSLALVATNLLATLPHLAVAAVARPKIAAAYSRAVSQTLFVMSDGQAADLASARIETVDDYLAMLRRKTGAEIGLFAATPAILAGADDAAVGSWVRFGITYGVMSQVFTDVLSTVAEGGQNDLWNGKRTLPVLYTMESLCDPEHAAFVADLDMVAAGQHDRLLEVVGRIESAGALRRSIDAVEQLRLQAAKALPVRLTGLERQHPIRVLLRSFRLDEE